MTTDTTDTKTMIEQCIKQLLDEVRALKPMKLVIGLELPARGDVQIYRIEMPSLEVVKDIAADARIVVIVPRDKFNKLASGKEGKKGGVDQWREAIRDGSVRVSGAQEVIKLIATVVERQQQRAQVRKIRSKPQ